VVTGASSGIGAALARGLAVRGHDLVLVARRADRLELLAKEIRDTSDVEVEVRECDLADRAQRTRLAGELRALTPSMLCANAGFPTCGPLAGADPAREAAQVEVNVAAVHELVLAVLPGMLARRSGSILVTGSTAGDQPVPTAATYSASKAFANTFAQALAAELRGTGVTCTLLSPGPVRTEFTAVGGITGAESYRWVGWQTPDRVAAAALRAAARGRRVVVPGPLAKAQALGARLLPRRLLYPLLRTVILPRLRAGPPPARR
jgi:uncharacterized protein